MIRPLLLALILLAPTVAHGQVASDDDLEARALRDLGEYVRDARQVASLPTGSFRGVDLIGPPRLQIVETPVCAVSILTLDYGGRRDGPVTGVGAWTQYRLAVENDGESANTYTTLFGACDDALRDRRSRWFVAEFDSSEWSLMYNVVWKASGLLSALRRAEPDFDDINLVEFRRQSEGQAIQALERASGQDISHVRMMDCAGDADEACRLAEFSWGNQLMLRVTYRRDAQQRWSVTAVDAHWSDMVVVP